MAEATIPDTIGYLILGLAVTVIIMAAYIGSMVIRLRNARKDLTLVEQLSKDEK